MKRRWLKRTLWVLLGTLGALVLLVAGALVFLATPPGGEQLRRLVVKEANQSIRGRLAIGRLAFHGNGISLWDVSLDDPEQRQVAHVDRLEVRLALTQLLHKRIDLTRVVLAAPALHLTQDARGMNLARAIESRKPTQPRAAGEEKPSTLSIAVDDFQLSEGEVDFQRSAGGSEQHVWADALSSRATLQMKDGGKSLEAKLSLDGELRAPRRGPIHLKTRASGDGDHRVAEVALELAGAVLTANGSIDGTRLGSVIGKVDLTVPRMAFGETELGPIELHARADRGRFQIPRLEAHAPGLDLNASGQGSRRKLDLVASLDARDLAQLSAAIAELSGKRLPMRGHAKLTARALGSLSTPALEAEVEVPDLSFGTQRVRGLSARLSSPNLKDPIDSRARLTADALALGARRFQKIALAFAGEASQVSLAARANSPGPLALDARARVDPDRRGLKLTALDLSYPEAHWVLRQPARIAFRGGGVAVETLALAADGQRIRLDLHQTGARIDAVADIDHFDLGRLPKAFVDPKLALAGIVDLHARAHGPLKRPEGRAELHLRKGQFKRLRGLSVALRGSFEHERAKGRLEASGEGVRLATQFDVPVEGLLEGDGEAIRLKAHVDRFEIEKTLQAMGVSVPAGGTLAADVEVSGTAADPELRATVSGRQVRYREAPPLDVEARVDATPEKGLAAHLRWTVAKSRNDVQLAAPIHLGRVIRHPPRPAEAMEIPVSIDADLRELPLPLLYTSGLSNKEWLGTLSLKARLRGPARRPRGEAVLTMGGLTTNGLPPVESRVELSLGNETRLELRATQEKKTIAHLEATLAASAGSLRTPKAIASAPLSVRGHLGPLPLSAVQMWMAPDEEALQEIHQLGGTLDLDLQATGSLADPRVAVRGNVDRIARSGRIELDYHYANARHQARATLSAPDKSQLVLDARTRLDLSYPALTAGLNPSNAPLDATLKANGFDPSFLQNLSPEIEHLEGKIVADAHATGPLARPQVAGTLEWTNGRLEIIGTADYQKLHLKLAGNRDRIDLTDLSADAGSGKAHLTASAQLQGQARYAVHADAQLDRFPLIAEDQLLGNLTLKAQVDGTASAQRIDLPKVAISEARMELPEVHRKDLQKLSTPKDIVLVRNGRPLKKEKEKQAQAAGVGGAGSAGSPASTGPIVHVRFQAPRNLWVKGSDMNIELGLSDNFRFDYSGAPQLYGDVLVHRGRVDVMGRRFDLVRDSKVTFTGPLMEPDLAVKATYDNTTEQVKVTMNVSGTPKSLQLQPTSEPPMSETEIYTLLATGHTTLAHGSGKSSPSGAAASALGGMIAGELKKTLQDKLPLDVLSIQAGDQGLSGTTLEAGTYVNDRLYLGFKGRIGANADPLHQQNSNEADVEYQLTKRTSVQAAYGDAKVGNADLIWSKDY